MLSETDNKTIKEATDLERKQWWCILNTWGWPVNRLLPAESKKGDQDGTEVRRGELMEFINDTTAGHRDAVRKYYYGQWQDDKASVPVLKC